MSQDVTQWLAEIQSLQRQVKELQRSRDEACASADKLRQLYEAEGQQRRRDNAAYSHKIKQLEQALAEFNAPSIADSKQLNVEITNIPSTPASLTQLQSQLVATQKQCETLKTLLKNEQAEHARTRENLTAALGDAVDLLAKERAEENSQKQTD
ncbi:MAG: hypothetical protein HC800_05725 [Phormidesmis sp. RL_2_1]|nr:hypothetical protein [Phormidesmis sp. RL_2_1]